MRILTIGDATSPHILSRAKYFLKLGHINHMLSPYFIHDTYISIESPPYQWTSNSFFKNLVNFLRNILYILNVLNKDFDIVHIYYPTNYIAWVASLFSRKPNVVIVMGGDVLFEQNPDLPWCNRLLIQCVLQKASLIISKSPYIENKVKLLTNAPTKICLFGVDQEFFQPQIQKQKSPLVFLSTRGLNPFYNIETIIDVIEHIYSKRKDIILLVVCFHGNKEYLTFLKEKVKSKNLESVVSFIESVSCSKELIPLYLKSHFVISLPFSDGIPQSTIEGIAQRCVPILRNNIHYEGVFDETNSILVNGDSEQIASKILEKINSEEIDKILEKSYNFIKKNADLHKNIDFLSNDCEKILHDPKNHRRFIKILVNYKMFFLLCVYIFDNFFFIGIRNRFIKLIKKFT